MKIIIVTVLSLFLAACASNHAQLGAPCPNFGSSCTQAPINSWDYK